MTVLTLCVILYTVNYRKELTVMSKEWDKENMKTLACRVRREEAEAFRAYADSRRTTAHALLADYVRRVVATQTNMSASASKVIEELAAEVDMQKVELERLKAEYDEMKTLAQHLEIRATRAENIVHDYILAK